MNYWLDTTLGWKHKGLLSFILQWKAGDITIDDINKAFIEQCGQERAASQTLKFENGCFTDKLLIISKCGRTALFTYLSLLRKKGYLWLEVEKSGTFQFVNFTYHASEEQVPLWKLYYKLDTLEDDRSEKKYNKSPWLYFSTLREHYGKYLMEDGKRNDNIEELIDSFLRDKKPEFSWSQIQPSFNELPQSYKNILIKYSEYIVDFPGQYLLNK